jgi:hypothetical protein
VAGRGLFNKLVDTFNAVADEGRRQLAPKDQVTDRVDDTGAQAAESHFDSARRVSEDSGRMVGSDDARRVVTDGARQGSVDDSVECRFCKTPNVAGAACAGCGATPDR